MAGHQGYAPALSYMQNTFGMLAVANNNDDSANTIATQMAALLLQSQLTISTAANTSQQQNHLIQNLAHQQTLLHANQHWISW
jgi:hypothetical protein